MVREHSFPYSVSGPGCQYGSTYFCTSPICSILAFPLLSPTQECLSTVRREIYHWWLLLVIQLVQICQVLLVIQIVERTNADWRWLPCQCLSPFDRRGVPDGTSGHDLISGVSWIDGQSKKWILVLKRLRTTVIGQNGEILV